MKDDDIDCDDPKNKDHLACTVGEMVALPALIVIMTLGAWIVGGIIIAVLYHKLPKSRKVVLVVGILVCLMVPVAILLLQKFAHWPMPDL